VVVLALRGKRLDFTIRADLPSTSADAPVAETVESLVGGLLRRGATAALVAGFGAAELVGPTLRALRVAYDQVGIRVHELLRVDAGRFWSYLCDDPHCCPPQGSSYDSQSTEVAAVATLAGCVALPDRSTYERQILPVRGAELAAAEAATRRADDRLYQLICTPSTEEDSLAALLTAGRLAINAAVRAQRSGARLSDEEVAWLTVLLASVPVRDLAWVRITGARPELELHKSLWLEVLRRATPDLIPAPGTLFAFAAWRCGEPSLARLALARVLDEEPSYWLAKAIDKALALGTPPSALRGWPQSAFTRRFARRRSRRSSSPLAKSRRR
jgi:uncharacterized protein DUF4192